MKQSLFTLALSLPLAAIALGAIMCEKKEPKTIHQQRIEDAKIELNKRWDMYSNAVIADTAHVKDFSKSYDSVCDFTYTLIWYKHATENQYKR